MRVSSWATGFRESIPPYLLVLLIVFTTVRIRRHFRYAWEASCSHQAVLSASRCHLDPGVCLSVATRDAWFGEIWLRYIIRDAPEPSAELAPIIIINIKNRIY